MQENTAYYYFFSLFIKATPIFYYICTEKQNKPLPYTIMAQLRIKEICKEKGLTLNALAEKIGISQPSISGIATGKQKPSFDTLDKLAEALGVEVSELFAPKSDFVAMVSSGGETKRFDSAEDLAEYIRPMIEG